MLAWLVEEVASPYGGVATLHWAVPDDPEDRSLDKFNSTEVQVRLESAEDQLGAVLWNSNPAALAYLHKYVFSLAQVTSSSPPPLEGKVVVELGAGVGCLGIALAMGGARVAVTDMKELLPLMAYNVQLNSKRILSRSQGVGRCTALQWKWGPTATTSVHKQLQRALKGVKTSVEDVVAKVLTAMATELAKPSSALVDCSTALDTAAAAALPYNYLVMCDALYGNPKDWPALLYTLTELLATNPDGCEIVNFCEQRVDDVEGAFLAMLAKENGRAYIPASQRDAAGDPLWTAVLESAGRCCPPQSSTAGTAEEKREASPSSGATSSSPAAVELHKAREEASAALLNYVLVQRRGAYQWTYSTEVVAEAQSELNMTIRATRIRWTKVNSGSAAAAPSRRRARDDEDGDGAESGAMKKRKH